MDPGSPRIRLQIYRAPKLGSPSAWGKMAKVAPPPPSTITIGICAMDKKADGKPMKELLKRLEKKSVEFVRFGDELLLNVPVAPAFALECVWLCLHTHSPAGPVLQQHADRRPPALPLSRV